MSNWNRIQKDLLCFILIKKPSPFKSNQNNRHMIKKLRQIGTRSFLNAINIIHRYFKIYSFRHLSDRITIRLPTERFSWNFVFGMSIKNLSRYVQVRLKSVKSNGHLTWIRGKSHIADSHLCNFIIPSRIDCYCIIRKDQQLVSLV
jgi:hypothetical protein